MTTTFGYEVIEGWEKLPAGYVHGNVQGVRVDSHDRVYVLTCWDPRLIIYEQDGTFVKSWGENIFSPSVHGLELGPDGSVYITDAGDHTVRKFTPDRSLHRPRWTGVCLKPAVECWGVFVPVRYH